MHRAHRNVEHGVLLVENFIEVQSIEDCITEFNLKVDRFSTLINVLLGKDLPIADALDKDTLLDQPMDLLARINNEKDVVFTGTLNLLLLC